jgi:hypothetical protein
MIPRVRAKHNVPRPRSVSRTCTSSPMVERVSGLERAQVLLLLLLLLVRAHRRSRAVKASRCPPVVGACRSKELSVSEMASCQ